MTAEKRDTDKNTMHKGNAQRPLFCGRAVYADESAFYRKPQEASPGDMVKVRVRTLEENVDSVYLRISGNSDTKEYLPMSVTARWNGFDYYESSFMAGRVPTEYDFLLHRGSRTFIYGRMGLTSPRERNVPFLLVPGYHIPEWAQGAVMYQIFPDRFCNGDPDNDVMDNEYFYINRMVRHEKNWDAPPRTFDVHRFYGGDLQGIINKLDYLQDLGVEVLYLNPVFVSPSNHKYDTQDYAHVDPHLGKIVHDGGSPLKTGERNNANADKYRIRTTDPENLKASDDLLRELIAEAHKRGMKVILDGVFNHCGSFNRWFDAEHIYDQIPDTPPGAFHTADSPYRDYFRFSNSFGWPENRSCDYWWGNATLPKLAHEDSPALRDEIMGIAQKWIGGEDGADGWRLDVAADLGYSNDFNHRFWQIFRSKVREIDPEALIIAEHYGDASSYLRGGEWDTVMNYDAFMDPVSYFLTGMEKHSDREVPELRGSGAAFANAMRENMKQFGTTSLLCAMNELDNHDHSRFLTRTNHKEGRLATLGTKAAGEGISFPVMRIAVVMQMTWIGAPTVYYGDEAGVVGFTDPDCRRTYPWGHENYELLTFYKVAIAMHRNHESLRRGSIKMLETGEDFISYGRFTEREQCVIVVNLSDREKDAVIPVWETGLRRNADYQMQCILWTTEQGFDDESNDIPVRDGMLSVHLAPKEASVFLYSVPLTNELINMSREEPEAES